MANVCTQVEGGKKDMRGSRSMLPVLRALARADDQGLPPLRLEIYGELDPAAKRFLEVHALAHRVRVSGRIPPRLGI